MPLHLSSLQVYRTLAIGLNVNLDRNDDRNNRKSFKEKADSAAELSYEEPMLASTKKHDKALVKMQCI